jgi:hypothetical protein
MMLLGYREMMLAEAVEAAKLNRQVRWWRAGWRSGKMVRLDHGKNGHCIAVIKDAKGREVRHEITLLCLDAEARRIPRATVRENGTRAISK